MKLTNVYGLSLPLAVWLLHDEYDHVKEPNYISATSLLKSTRQLVLSRRVNQEERVMDISAYLASRMGTAIHDSIEKSWRESGTEAMKKLGYPDHIAESVRVNPTDEELAANPNIIPVWMEKRAFRKITVDGIEFTVGGKYDMVMDGRLFDAKTTSVFAYTSGRKDDDYAKQGGVYRWLNSELIVDDHIYIQFIFTDWQKARARNDETYPQTKAIEYPVLMPTLEETEQFIKGKISEVMKYRNAPDEDIPHCNDKELWRADPVFKYYSDASKTDGRATKNFDNKADAYAHLTAKGKGTVIMQTGDARACEFCPAFDVCKQKDLYYVAP